jgi:TonB family protein
MADLVQSGLPIEPEADRHLSHLLAAEPEPWFKSLIRNVKETINPPKLPPLEVTSKPVAVKEIWGLYGQDKKSFMMSTSFQVVVVILLFTVASSKTVQNTVKAAITPLIAPNLEPYTPKVAPQKQTMGGGGGGGDHSPLPPSKGQAPKFSPRQFTPPQQVIANPNPILQMEPTLIGDPNIKLPQNNLPVWGDPTATRIGPPSNGPGSGGGIGSGSGGGIGSGKGGGLGPGEGGGVGGGVFRVGGGVTAPTLLAKVEPEYSEEARRAKYQGTVVLYVEVAPDGKAHNLKVIRSLGLGLDEKAIEAVNKWRFRPGYKDGKAVTVAATIEVNFRLL